MRYIFTPKNEIHIHGIGAKFGIPEIIELEEIQIY